MYIQKDLYFIQSRTRAWSGFSVVFYSFFVHCGSDFMLLLIAIEILLMETTCKKNMDMITFYRCLDYNIKRQEQGRWDFLYK